MIQSLARRRQRIALIVLLLLVAVTMLVSASWGYSNLGIKRVLPVLFGDGSRKEEFVLFSIRLPRIAITFLAGVGLALSGAILQRVTRNDLADPGIIGINTGAGLGVAVFFLFAPIEPGSFVYLLTLVAFASAMLTAFFIYLFSYRKGEGLNPVRLVLIGVGFSLSISGIMTVVISSVSDREKVDFIAKWLSGSIWGTDWVFIWALLPWLLLLIPFTLYKANQLNLLELSEPVAVGIGLPVQKERIWLLIAAVALAASSVSVTGGISFIGLMAPHIAKALVGPRNQLSLPIAMLIGGWLLLAADTIGRNLADPNGVPAGVVAAFIGAPYFVYLLLRRTTS
ncbi:ABC-type Fe3+-siderophore transport system, permease 2 component [Paenibacillus pasadenensis]|uniref:ABC-type Fe3+-siderophore transport system, permease 2 component n=1 Tax=Paenibacillus pasadenensis TaxID=217090 RepID=A0A2N5N4R1_9BACL|nr:iron ABC transporter permease [Paenibacillus pasadenensis]PLT45279.1 ABC-type Fe3+-siderophore transport system, permease 2 component [Paenibacillus pasadenensis]